MNLSLRLFWLAVTSALVRARFLAREGGSIQPAEVVALAGDAAPMPTEPPEYAARWNEENATWRGAS